LSGIRVTYSGLISLAVGLTSLITGLIFITILTRTLTPDEFGSWRLILSLVGYVIVMESSISYWIQREIPRGINSAKTGFFASLIFSFIGSGIYLVVSFVVGQKTDVDLGILFLATILVPFMFIQKTLTGITFSWKPHAVSLTSLFTEISKIPVALVLIYFFEMGIVGVIFTFLFIYVSSSIILAFLSRHKLKDKIKIKFVKKWFKLSWIPLYPGIASLLLVLDVIIFSLITESVYGLAFYAAAVAVSRIVANSNNISKVVYPKILGTGKGEYIQQNLILFFYFAFPLAALSISFSKPALFVLNPIYIDASLIVVFLTIKAFFASINVMLNMFLTAVENVDINEKSSFRDYIKSKLFLLPTLHLITFSTYIISLVIILILLQSEKTELELVLYWAIIGAIVQIPLTIILLVLAKKELHITIKNKRILCYFVVSVLTFSLVYFVMDETLYYNKNLFEFAPIVVLFAFFGFGIYLGITYIIDPKIRSLVKAITSEIIKKK